jgi:hypothetical protein
MSVWIRGILTAVMYYLRRGNSLPAVTIVVVAIFALRAPRVGSSTLSRQPFHSHSHIRQMLPLLSQDDDADENEVSTDEVEKYVSVYKAMQRNRSLTVDQAAAAQGLTLEQFRQLENRVQRDDAALQQARDELQAAAQGSPTPVKNPTPLHH